jgi:hypothetical protein
LIGYEESAIPVQAYGGEYYWSPTREYIVLESNGHLALLNVTKATELRFSTVEDPPSETFLDWSQDGQCLLYSPIDAEGKANLWLWDVAREEGEELLPQVSQAALSPDGLVAFLRQEDRPWQAPGEAEPETISENRLPALTLGLMDLATRETVLYGPAGYKSQETPQEPRGWQASRPVWSPDGELVVYWGEQGDV